MFTVFHPLLLLFVKYLSELFKFKILNTLFISFKMNFYFFSIIFFTFRGTDVMGGLIAIDPVTDSAMLVTNINDEVNNISQASVTIVPFVDWTSLAVIDGSENIKSKLKQLVTEHTDKKHNLTPEQLKEKQQKIKMHLAQYGLETKIDGDNLIIADIVIVVPPFTAEECSGTNEIVLGKIKKLLQNIT